MTLTQLAYVAAVHKYRHFGKAAKACYVTQPTLSMQLQKLEEELGGTIFDRSKSPIVPTQFGQAIIAQCKVVLQEQRKLSDIAKGRVSGLSGEFRLAVIPTLSTYVVPLFAQTFVKNYSHIHLVIEERKTEDIISLLEEDEIDVGILVTPLHRESLIEKPLFYEPFYLFVSPGHPLLKRRRVREEDLNIDEIWLLNKGNCFRDQVLRICSEKKPDKERDAIEFEGGTFETLKHMVLKSGGYTVLPHLAIGSLTKRERNLVREFSPPVPTREVSLVYRRSQLKKEMLEALERVLSDQVPQELKAFKKRDIEVVEFV